MTAGARRADRLGLVRRPAILPAPRGPHRAQGDHHRSGRRISGGASARALGRPRRDPVAGEEAGVPQIEDFNGGDNAGSSYFQVNQRAGRRWSTAAQPDIQLWCNPIRMDAQIWFPGYRKRQDDQITADVILLHPSSRGWLTLKSANPKDAPAITLNNFADLADLRTARDGIRLARQIYATEPQASLTGEELLPGADKQTDDELDAHIRQWAGVTQHPVGTCAMGHGSMSVVDPQLRVHGIKGLRVVDASIMPTVPGGNTNAPVIMVAEKASDMILGINPLPAVHPAFDAMRVGEMRTGPSTF
jgi:choline dehydrogenase-like flavoprotein